VRLKAIFGASAVGVTLALAGAGSASAATEIGDRCTAEGATQGYTLTQLQAAAGRAVTAPASGVVTQWGANLAPLPIPSLGMHLAILHPTGNPDEFTTSAESAAEPIRPGENTFQTRLPIGAGDRLGTTGTGVTEVVLYCPSSDASDVLGAVAGGAPAGSTHVFPGVTQARLAAWAKIEPDADADGYGDETQDKCPQSAAVQAECPAVILDAFVLAKKSSIIVIVGASTAAPVTVSASAKLPKVKKASASAVAKLKKVTHNVTPGKLRYFSLKYTAGLKQALADLPQGKKLKLKITASATNVAGQVSKDKTTVKLKGAA